MKTINKIILSGIAIIVIALTIAACSSTKNTYNQVADNTTEFTMEKSGAQLWGEVCNRCHISPSPAAYNDIDWGTISLHMRIRANLTEQEITKIEEFLVSAN